MDRSCEDHLVAFVDFLGFSEATSSAERTAGLLDLLIAVSSLQSEFSAIAEPLQGADGRMIHIKPAVRTFSDHIVISYPLRGLYGDGAPLDQATAPFFVWPQLQRIISYVAAAALRLGLLIRGGVTIGELFHSGQVIFGKALVEAYGIESRTAVYPRVIISPTIAAKPEWLGSAFFVSKDADGLHCLEYFGSLLWESGDRGATNYQEQVKAWFDSAVRVIERNVAELRHERRLNEFAKWAWFARKFRAALDSRQNQQLLKAIGASADSIPII